MTDSIEEFGPIDFLVIEFPSDKRVGDGLPLLLELVDNHTVRILDLVFVQKDRASVASLVTPDELVERGGAELLEFEGASSGLISDDDLESIAEVLAPDSVACVMVYENTWAAPLARAVRRGGGQMVASGRIPVQALLAALDVAEHAA
jgi:hypothetical protein